MVDHVNAKVPMQLTLVDLTGIEDAPWVRALKESCPGQWGDNLASLADAQVALENDENRFLVIAYCNPTWQIADELRRHNPPAEALVKWQDFAAKLLWLHEEFCDRITVAMLPSTLQEVDQMSKHLGYSTGLQCEEVKDFTAGKPDDKPESSAEDNGLTVAAMHLLTLRRPKGLLERLENITLPASEEPYVPGMIAQFLSSQEVLLRDSVEAKGLRVETRGQKKELSNVKQENTIVIKQLHRTQEELEQYLLRQRKLNEKLKGLRRGRDYRKTKVAELEGQAREQNVKIEALRRGRDYRKDKVAGLQSGLRQRDEKIEWLRSVRDQHRRTARSLRAERRQQETDMKVLENRLADLEEQLTKIETSRSWRYTKVLRKIRGTEK